MNLDQQAKQHLKTIQQENEEGFAAVFDRLYSDLKSQARRQRYFSSFNNDTLNTTAIVNESYLKLIQNNEVDWNDDHHFINIAARAMRFFIIDYSRTKLYKKNGDGDKALSLHELTDIDIGASLQQTVTLDEWIAIDRLLSTLYRRDPRMAKVIELRIFGDLNHDEIAVVLGVGIATVKRDWRTGLAWLRKELD